MRKEKVMMTLSSADSDSDIDVDTTLMTSKSNH